MSPLNKLMNRCAELTESPSRFKRNVAPRIIMPVCCAPVEAFVALQNTIKLPFEMALFCVKIPAKTFSLIAYSKNLKEFADALPGPTKIVNTALKIAGYALGTIFTLTLGFLSPISNFRLHYSLNLIRNYKVEADALRIEQEKLELQRKHEKQIQAYVATIVESMREANAIEPVAPPAVPDPQIEPEVDFIDVSIHETPEEIVA